MLLFYPELHEHKKLTLYGFPDFFYNGVMSNDRVQLLNGVVDIALLSLQISSFLVNREDRLLELLQPGFK